MPLVFLFFSDTGFQEELTRSIRGIGPAVEIADGSAFRRGLRPGLNDGGFALVSWQPVEGFAADEVMMEKLRLGGIACIAVVEDADEEQACAVLGGSVLDVVARSRPGRLQRHLDAAGTHRQGTLPISDGTVTESAQTEPDGWSAAVRGDAILLFDDDRNILQWNSEAEALFGVGAGAASDEAAAAPFSGAREVMTSVLGMEAASGYWSGELTLTREDGVLLPVSARLHVLQSDTGGGRQHLLACRMSSGISDRVTSNKPEPGATQSWERLKGITYQRNASDPASLILLGAVRNLTGYDAADFLGGTVEWPELVHPEDKVRMLQVVQELMDGSRSSFDETYRIIDREGSIHKVKDVAGRWIDQKTAEVVISGLVLEIHQERDFTDRMVLSEMMYRNLWEMESDALFLIDRETGHIHEVNSTACALYGFERAELLNLRNVDLSAEPERTYSATHSEVTAIPVRWHRKKDGTVFPVEIHATHFVWNGRSVHLAAIRDISERLRHEALLRDAEIRYRTFFEQSPDGIVVLDPISLHPREFNSVAHEQLGCSQAEFANRSLRDIFVERDRSLGELLADLREKGRIDFTALLRRNNGSFAEMDITFVNVELAERFVIYGILRDVTTRRVVEANLRTLSRAVEQSPTMIVITNADGVIEYVNPRFTAVTGYNPEEVMGQSPRLLKSGETPSAIYEELWKTLAAGEEWRGEMQNRRKSGDVYWALVSISPVRDSHGATRHFVAVQEDITSAKRTQQDLIEAKERAERSDRLKDAFIANMSHEIRTPLNIILGFTGVLKALLENNTDDEVDLCLDSIERGGARLLRTVEEILNISSIQAGTFPHAPLPLPVDHHVDNTVKDFSAQANEKALTLRFEPGCEDCYIVADPYVFVQALSNLLDNAMKFTKKGGVVVSTRAVNSEVIVEVEDTGIGIAGEYLPYLFESFSQEYSGNSRPFEGLGLGMALTRRYVQMCSGRIAVDSEKGRGTKFTMIFPASRIDQRS